MPSSTTSTPYTLALAMLARRELSTAQVRERLRRKGLTREEIESALHRLRQEGALDENRTALAFARHAATVKLRGRRRTLQELEGLGLMRAQARAAVDAVFGNLDEQALLERALARRLQGRIRDRSELRQLYQHLMRQGFDGGMAMAALKARAAAVTNITEEDGDC